MIETEMQTASGGGFDLRAPRVEDVNWGDVANALSRLCRFNGHIPIGTETYTVAQHCCLVADLLPPPLRFYGLLHDAHEAYFGDWISPLKQALLIQDAGYQVQCVEHPLEDILHMAAGVETPRQGPIADKIKHADMVALATERRDILAESAVGWRELPDPTPYRIKPWHRLQAYEEWMNRFSALGSRDVG